MTNHPENKGLRQIRLLRNEMINISRWDECIMSAFNGMIYGFSWYLDIVSEDWEGLVLGDYEAVMPLPVKRKLGFKYVIQPIFTQQLGVFSPQKITPELLLHFINHIPYKYINLTFNVYNILPENIKLQKERVTYELDLIQTHEVLSTRYSNNTKRNILKSKKAGTLVSKGLAPQEFIKFVSDTFVENKIGLKKQHYNMLRQITIFALRNRIGNIYAAHNSTNSLCAVALFLTTHHKTIMLVNAGNAEAKANGMMFHIIDEYIRENSNRNLILDFEGSVLEGVARFYKSFNATPSTYNHLIKNKLPYLIKLLTNKK